MTHVRVGDLPEAVRDLLGVFGMGCYCHSIEKGLRDTFLTSGDADTFMKNATNHLLDIRSQCDEVLTVFKMETKEDGGDGK